MRRLTLALVAVAAVAALTIPATSIARPPVPPVIGLDYLNTARDSGPLGNPGCVANYVVTGNNVTTGEPLYVEVRFNGGGWISLGQTPYSYGMTVSFANQIPGASTTDYRVSVIHAAVTYWSYNTIQTAWDGGPNCH